MRFFGCSPEGKRHLYVGFSPTHPKESREMASIFESGIMKLRKSGKLDKILNKYGLHDWVTSN